MAEETTPERIQMWRDSLDRIEAMGESTMVSGHKGPGAVRDPSIFGVTRASMTIGTARWPRHPSPRRCAPP